MSSSFHISIAWTLDQPTGSMRQAVEEVMKGVDMRVGLKVLAVKAKVGNAVTSFSLTARKENNSGII